MSAIGVDTDVRWQDLVEASPEEEVVVVEEEDAEEVESEESEQDEEPVDEVDAAFFALTGKHLDEVEDEEEVAEIIMACLCGW